MKERKDKGRVSNGWECMGWKNGSSSFENCEANLGISRRVASWLDSLSSSFIIGRNYAICIEMEITSDFNGMLKAIDREIYPSHGFLGISVEAMNLYPVKQSSIDFDERTISIVNFCILFEIIIRRKEEKKIIKSLFTLFFMNS